MSASNGGGYERSDVHIPSVWKFIAGVFGLIGLALLLMLGLFRLLYRSELANAPAPTPMEARRVLPPAPRLQVTTTVDLADLRRKEDEALLNYGWVNKDAGVVRVPIARAIELIVERGIPRPRPSPAPQPPPAAGKR